MNVLVVFRTIKQKKINKINVIARRFSSNRSKVINAAIKANFPVSFLTKRVATVKSIKMLFFYLTRLTQKYFILFLLITILLQFHIHNFMFNLVVKFLVMLSRYKDIKTQM